MNKTSTIHSVDTEHIYAVLKFSFSKQYKIHCFNPLCLCHRPMVNSLKTRFAQQQSIVATPLVNQLMQAQCRHVFPSKPHEKRL